MVNNDDAGYQRLVTYVQDRVNDYLRKKGKYREAGEDIWVVYARKSRKEKDKQERSIPDQLSDLKGWATAEGIKPVKIFQENESAKVSGKRPLFNEMVEGIKKGKWNAILSWHPNRIARNMLEAGMIIDLLDSGKITNLHFHNYYFGGEPNDIMALGINFVLAKQYSDNLSQVSTRGTNKIVAEGKAPTRKPKYGYMLNRSNHYRPDIHNGKDNFKLIQNAFKMALMREPLVKIVDYLKQEQFEYDGKICNITKQKVSQILSDPIYAGIFLYGNVFTELNLVDPGFVPAVTPDEFMQLRALMDKKYSFKPTSRTKAILFSKMVYCGYCCNLMTPGKPLSANKRTRYYELR